MHNERTAFQPKNCGTCYRPRGEIPVIPPAPAAEILGYLRRNYIPIGRYLSRPVGLFICCNTQTEEIEEM